MLDSATNASVSSFAAPSSRAGDGGFSFGRTSSIQPQVFPSRPSLGRSQPSQSSMNSSNGGSYYPAAQRSYAVPPGLAAANASSVSLKSQKPRSARADYAPPLPAGAHWLLLSTPPPPPRAAADPLRSDLNHHAVTTFASIDSRDSQEQDFIPKKSWGKKSLAALGLRGTGSQGQRPSRRAVTGPTSSAVPSQPPAGPRTVQLQLGGGGVASPRPSTSSRRGGKLDSRSEEYEIPRTWEDYALRYGLGEMNIEDPPFPPIQSLSHSSARPTPFHEGNFNAPASPLEPIRQKLIARLDLLGKGSNDSLPSSSAMMYGGSASSRQSHRDSIFTNNRDSMVSTAPSSAPSPNLPHNILTSSLPSPRSIQNHPALLAILAKSRKLFGTRTTIISILEEHRQHFLASEGMPDKVDSLPRSSSLDSHTVLNGERGLVVLDTQRDWRFRSNMLSLVLGARFYAGMPIFAPSHPELEEEAGGRLPIGTIAILDDQCRLDFSPAERAKLRSLATDVSNEIHNWVSGHWERRSSVSSISSTTNRLKHVSFDSSSSYIDWQIKTATTVPPPAASSHFVAARRVPAKVDSLPPTPPGSLRRPGRYPEGEEDTSKRSHASLAPPAVLGRTLSPMPEESPATTPLSPPTGASEGIIPPASYVVPSSGHGGSAPVDAPAAAAASKPVFPSARSRPQPKSPQQKLFDAATSALGKGLDLSLVYLVALDLTNEAELDTPLTLLSAYGLPSNKPSFDPSLHLKALRAPEGGLLFKNPLVTATSAKNEGPYASGILLPVCESEEEKRGWVLSSYTCDASREWVEEELEYMGEVINQLKKVIGWAARAEKQ